VLVFDVELLDFLPETVLRERMQQLQRQQGAGGPPTGAGSIPGQ